MKVDKHDMMFCAFTKAQSKPFVEAIPPLYAAAKT